MTLRKQIEKLIERLGKTSLVGCALVSIGLAGKLVVNDGSLSGLPVGASPKSSQLSSSSFWCFAGVLIGSDFVSFASIFGSTGLVGVGSSSFIQSSSLEMKVATGFGGSIGSGSLFVCQSVCQIE